MAELGHASGSGDPQTPLGGRASLKREPTTPFSPLRKKPAVRTGLDTAHAQLVRWETLRLRHQRLLLSTQRQLAQQTALVAFLELERAIARSD